MRSVFLLLCVVAMLLPQAAFAGTVRVPEDVMHLRLAMMAVSDGDTILIGPGTYADSSIFVRRSMTLLGTDGMMTTNLVNNKGPVLIVDNIATFVLSGLTLDGGGVGEFGVISRNSNIAIESCRLRRFEGSGIDLLDCEFQMIATVATGCRTGLSLKSCKDVTLYRNLFAGNGVGVYVLDCNPLIESNRFKRNDVGIEIRGNSSPVVGGSLEKGNRFQRPARYGFHVRNLGDNTVDCQYNSWYGGDFCEFKRYLFGELDYLPYANKTLTDSYDDCP
jgi:parallel beta-helix repeat protein